jgi:hypothetical protein
MVCSAASPVIELAQLWGGFVEGEAHVLACLFDPDLAAMAGSPAPVGCAADAGPTWVAAHDAAFRRWQAHCHVNKYLP